jgi:tetratricopeptide (TPR) repeat protein
MDPAYALTWAHLGQAYEANASLQFGGRGQYQKALEAYRHALQLNPALIEARVNMGNLFIDTGRVEEAVPILLTALEGNRNSAAAHWELGYAYRFGGLLEDSVQECERARQIDPSVKIVSSAINAFFYLGRYDRWLASLPDSNSAYILFYRGFGEYYTGDYAQATAHFNRAFDTDPALLQAEVGKALSDSIAHHNAAGLQLLRQTEAKVQERGVTDAEGIYKVAQAYAVLGDKQSALRVFKQSVEGGFFPYPYFQTDPLLNNIRGETEFGSLMNQARLRYERFRARFSPARSGS